MQDEGYVAKMMYPAGEKDIPLGKLLAIIVDNESDIAAFANFVDEDAPAAAAPQAAEPAAPKTASTPASSPVATPVAAQVAAA